MLGSLCHESLFLLKTTSTKMSVFNVSIFLVQVICILCLLSLIIWNSWTVLTDHNYILFVQTYKNSSKFLLLYLLYYFLVLWYWFFIRSKFFKIFPVCLYQWILMCFLYCVFLCKPYKGKYTLSYSPFWLDTTTFCLFVDRNPPITESPRKSPRSLQETELDSLPKYSQKGTFW